MNCIQEYPLPVLAPLTTSSGVPPSNSNVVVLSPAGPSSASTEPAIFTIVDPEIVRENPVEAKHRRLVRSHRNGPLDRELKPNAKIRDELNVRVAAGAPCFYAPGIDFTLIRRTFFAILQHKSSQRLNVTSSGNSASSSLVTNAL